MPQRRRAKVRKLSTLLADWDGTAERFGSVPVARDEFSERHTPAARNRKQFERSGSKHIYAPRTDVPNGTSRAPLYHPMQPGPPGVLHGFIRTRPSDREHFLNLRIYVELREIAGSCGSFQRRAMPASLVTVRHRARQLAHRHHQVPKSRVQMPSTAHVIQRGCQQRRASVLPRRNVSATNFTPWPSGLLAYHSIFVRIPAYSGIMPNGE